MNKKKFYDEHRNFSRRTISEYYISPGIRCKFDLLIENLGSIINFNNGIDLGCSGNSFLYFYDNVMFKSFFDLASLPLKVYASKSTWHAACGDVIHLPYKDASFDFVSALDLLEHVENDELVIAEISRILKRNGIAAITVPHRKKYFTRQDALIGHYRRYEIGEITAMFEKQGLKRLKTFGIYGQLMRIADTQSASPEKTEQGIQKLRDRYESDAVFRKTWNFVVSISSKMMKIDAKYQPLKRIMNMGFIFIKK